MHRFLTNDCFYRVIHLAANFTIFYYDDNDLQKLFCFAINTFQSLINRIIILYRNRHRDRNFSEIARIAFFFEISTQTRGAERYRIVVASYY